MSRRAKGKRPAPWDVFHEVPSDPGERAFESRRYRVLVIPQPGGWTWLSIKRIDKAAIHDWRELQRIKTVLCGPDREALELYPAEARLVDTSNQFHLWVMPKGERFAFGWDDGRVIVDGDDRQIAGKSRQRPLPEYMEQTLTPEACDLGGKIFIASGLPRHPAPAELIETMSRITRSNDDGEA